MGGDLSEGRAEAARRPEWASSATRAQKVPAGHVSRYLGHMWELYVVWTWIAAQVVGWQWVFVCLVPGPLLGVIALRGLTRAP